MDDSNDTGAQQAGGKTKIKVALLGNEGVGKTSLLTMFTENRHNAKTNTTVGAMFVNKQMPINGVDYDMQIWDTAGQERFRTIASIYFRDAHGIILAYDVTNRKSYDDLTFWFNEIYSKCEKSVVVLVVGNKCDMTNVEVTAEEAAKFTQGHKSRHLFVSAKTGQNVDGAFEILLRDVISSEVLVDLTKKYKDSVAIKKGSSRKKDKKGCC